MATNMHGSYISLQNHKSGTLEKDNHSKDKDKTIQVYNMNGKCNQKIKHIFLTTCNCAMLGLDISLSLCITKGGLGLKQNTCERVFIYTIPTPWQSIPKATMGCQPIYCSLLPLFHKLCTKNHITLVSTKWKESICFGKGEWGSARRGRQSITNVGSFHPFRAYDVAIFIQISWGVRAKLSLLNLNPKFLILNPILFFIFLEWSTFDVYVPYFNGITWKSFVNFMSNEFNLAPILCHASFSMH